MQPGKALAVKDYVLDANAVLRYFKVGTADGGDKVRALFEDALRGKARLAMSAVNLGEVHYVLLRYLSEENALRYVRSLEHAVSITSADLEQAIRAAALKHRYKLGYADSFAAELALASGATLVSADPGFEKVGKLIKWLKLPPFGSGKE